LRHLTEAQRQYIQSIVQGIPFLAFDHDSGHFEVREDTSDPSWEQVKLLGVATRRLSRQRPPQPSLFRVRLGDIHTGYYDRCLEHYCCERLDLNVPHEQTCWARFASKTHCLGRIDPDDPFDYRAKVQFLDRLAHEEAGNYVAMSIYRAYRKQPGLADALKKDADGWVFFWGNVAIRPLDVRGRLVSWLRETARGAIRSTPDDRVLGVVHSIETHGWDNDLAWPATEGGAVLGYSRSTNRHMVLTGRHRVAAARHLYSGNKLDGETILELPVITYSWGTWRHGRPYPGNPVCEWCRS
jgi:hypothetical protein